MVAYKSFELWIFWFCFCSCGWVKPQPRRGLQHPGISEAGTEAGTLGQGDTGMATDIKGNMVQTDTAANNSTTSTTSGTTAPSILTIRMIMQGKVSDRIRTLERC